MTGFRTWRHRSAASLLALWVGACGSDHESTEGDGSADGTSDGSGDGSADGTPSDGSDGTPSDGTPDGDAGCDCSGDTPVCFEGACVACTADDLSACADGETCSPDHLCLDANAPFALNCASLPSDGVCQGGPREVLLAVEETGYVGMFDPVDGHFLGPFKRLTVPRKLNLDQAGDERRDEYTHATQGPDQCIWMAGEGDRGVERWDTDGSFKDNIIPYDLYYRNQELLLDDIYQVAFSQDSVYVASYGYPNAPVVRFDRSALRPDMAATVDQYDVLVDDDQSEIKSLLVLGDGSIVASNQSQGRVEVRKANGEFDHAVLGELSSAGQVSYAGEDDVVVCENTLGGSMYQVDVTTGEVTYTVKPKDFGGTNMWGVAPLENGTWLFTSGEQGVSTINPVPRTDMAPPIPEQVWSDPGSGATNFKMIGRACLSEEFVASRATDAPVSDCAEPAGDPLFVEDFESGDFMGADDQRNFNGFYERPSTGVTVSIDGTLGAATSARSLKIAGGLEQVLSESPSGVLRTFAPGMTPSYVSYYVRVDTDEGSGGFFIMNPAASDELDRVYVYGSTENSELPIPSISTGVLSASKPIMRDQWVLVQLRDFDWEERTYDLYVDCERVGDDISFSVWGGDDLHALELMNYTTESVSWFDEIVIK